MPIGLGTIQIAITALGLIETILNNSLSGEDSATLGDARGKLEGVLDSIVGGDNIQALTGLEAVIGTLQTAGSPRLGNVVASLLNLRNLLAGTNAVQQQPTPGNGPAAPPPDHPVPKGFPPPDSPDLAGGSSVITKGGMDLLRNFEGLILFAYDDAVAPPKPVPTGGVVRGTLTIGYGHTGSDVKPGLKWTEQQANDALADDVGHCVGQIKPSIHANLTDNQFSALVCFAFNVGAGAFRQSTALKDINANKLVNVPDDIALYHFARVNGQRVPSNGLVRRRAAEIALWNSP